MSDTPHIPTLPEIEARLAAFCPRDLGPKWQELAPAAVVLALGARQGELQLLFTKRSSALRAHSGEIAFPGGRVDPSDASFWHAAQRECHEELGIEPGALRRIARLDETPVLTAYRITPFVAILGASQLLRPEPREVEEAFFVPLARFLDPAIHHFEPRQLWGQTVVIHRFDAWREPIWGATGRILAQLLEVGLGYVPPAFARWREESGN